MDHCTCITDNYGGWVFHKIGYIRLHCQRNYNCYLTLMMVLGIVVQGLAECFISPRYLEYFSLQAPKGEEGLYLGFSHLHSFLSSILGFGLSGYLLDKYCPEPTLFASKAEWAAAASHAQYIWYYFGVIALISAIALIVYGQVTKRMDGKKIKASA